MPYLILTSNINFITRLYLQSPTSSMAYIKLQGQPFNGNKSEFIRFRQSFQIQQESLVSSQKGMSSILFYHDSFMNEMCQTKLEVISTKKKVIADNDSVSMVQYKMAVQKFENLRNERDTASIAVTANIMNAITEDVYNSIFADIEELTVEYRKPKENIFKLEHYPKLRATWQALENNFLPNISEAMANERSTLERLPDKSTLPQIFNAINLYVKNIGTFPVLDSNKNQVLKDGRPLYETPDKRPLMEILQRHVKRSSDSMKDYFIGKWTTTATDYDTMYNDLKLYVRSSNSSSITTSVTHSPSQQVVPYSAPPAAQPISLPTISANTAQQKSLPMISANAAIRDPHDSRPLRYSYGTTCINCQRDDHYARHCTSTRCEECDRTFPSYLDRVRHTMTHHRKRKHQDDYNDEEDHEE